MFLFKSVMEVRFNSVLNNSYYSTPVRLKIFNSQSDKHINSERSSNIFPNYISFKGEIRPVGLNPIFYSDKIKKDEMISLTPLIRDENKKFSLDKAADLFKEKIDRQLMLYSENDIEFAIKTVMARIPDASREEILSTLARMSSFSNYESLSGLEKFFEKEKVSSLERFKEITINSVLMYIGAPHKQLLKFHEGDNNVRRAVVVDRNTIRSIKKMKAEALRNDSFKTLSNAVNKGRIKLIVLDGWEAKTEDGYKSFNFAGAWGNLANALTSVIKEQRKGIDPFNDDIVADLKDLFGEDTEINIIKNPVFDLDKKTIAERFNTKTISKKQIKDFIEGLSVFGAPSKSKPKIVRDFDCKMSSREVEYNRELSRISKLGSPKALQKYKEEYLSKALKMDEVDLKTKTDLQEQLIKILYCTINAYSPRRIAKELKALNYEINENMKSHGQTIKDALFIIPNREKSFGLINYQNSKVNNIDDSQMIYVFDHNTPIDKNKKYGKFFVYMDDFSGSGQSLVDGCFRYIDFRLKNPSQSFIFAPLVYTEAAAERIKRAIFSARNDLRQKSFHDYLIGVNKVSELNDYIDLLPLTKKSLLKYCFHKGYKANSVNVVFPHVVPDNCSDAVGILLENFLRNKKANKAKFKLVKRNMIEYAASKENI